jgi:hypothetical protein
MDTRCVYRFDESEEGTRCERQIVPGWPARKCVFHIGHRDSGAEFALLLANRIASQQAVDARGFQFSSELQIQVADVPVPIDFRAARFDGGLLIEGTVFGGLLDLSESVFAQGARFHGAQFRAGLKIQHSSVPNGIELVRCRIAPHSEGFGLDLTSSTIGTLYCGFTTVSGHFYLRDTEVRRDAKLGGVSVEGIVDCSFARFRAGVEMNSCELNGGALFHGALVEGSRFQSMKAPRIGVLSFADILGSPNLWFEGVDLSRASFVRTELTRCSFQHVTWAERSRWITERTWALWDEFNAEIGTDEGQHLSNVARCYRQLVLHFSGQREFQEAAEFHFGELECSRKRSIAMSTGRVGRVLRRFASVLLCYRLASNYGTSYRRAIAVLGGLIPMLALLLMLAGIEPVRGGRAINYDLIGGRTASIEEWAGDVASSLTFALEVATLQRDRSFRAGSLSASVVISLAPILIAGQAALVLLAMRSRFRR